MERDRCQRPERIFDAGHGTKGALFTLTLFDPTSLLGYTQVELRGPKSHCAHLQKHVPPSKFAL
jgi:hypothetical protein